MGLAEWLALAALVVAAMAVPITIWATRRWGNRSARLEVSVTSAPLLPADVRHGLLVVTYRDVAVARPHLVSVSLRNTGPRDVSSEMFDGGRAIAIGFDQTFYGLTETKGSPLTVAAPVGAPAGPALVQLGPGLLKRGERWTFSAVTTGPVEVAIDAPLVDTHLRYESPDEGRAITVRMSVLGLSVEVPIRAGR